MTNVTNDYDVNFNVLTCCKGMTFRTRWTLSPSHLLRGRRLRWRRAWQGLRTQRPSRLGGGSTLKQNGIFSALAASSWPAYVSSVKPSICDGSKLTHFTFRVICRHTTIQSSQIQILLLVWFNGCVLKVMANTGLVVTAACCWLF